MRAPQARHRLLGFGSLAAGFVILVVLLAGGGPASAKLGGRIALPMAGADPCQAVMAAIEQSSPADLLATNGLEAKLPAAVLSRFDVASWTCLGDRVAERVEGFLIRLRDKAGEYAGAWLLLADGTTREGDWNSYLEFLLGQPLDVVPMPTGFVAGTRTESGQWLLANVSSHDTTAVWPVLRLRAAEIRSGEE